MSVGAIAMSLSTSSWPQTPNCFADLNCNATPHGLLVDPMRGKLAKECQVRGGPQTLIPDPRG